MKKRYEIIQNELNSLVKRGNLLHIALLYEHSNDNERKEWKKAIDEANIDIVKLPSFNLEYEVWYTEAQQYIKKFVPDRLSDFVMLYKNDKRKEISYLTYSISDAIIGIIARKGGEIIASPISAVSKMQQQVAILDGVRKVLDSKIYSLDFTIRADLFDSELAAARELLKTGFYRASGAMCGVVLEKHLGQVCLQHNISLHKKTPAINDYNEALKNASVIDLPTWRHIQMLGDLRNICCHDKSTEPSVEQASDLLEGVTKISKTIF